MAQATSWFSREWLPHGMRAQTCPPNCPTINKPTQKIYYVKMDQVLLNMNEKEYYEQYKKIPTWPGPEGRGIKIFDKTTTPTFKNMLNPDCYSNLEEEVKLYKDSKSNLNFISIYHVIMPIFRFGKQQKEKES